MTVYLQVPGNFHVSTHSAGRQPGRPDMRHVIHKVRFGMEMADGKVGHLQKLTLILPLTLWMLGNFLKIDYIGVYFLKPVNSACFLLGMMDWVANRLDPTCLH